MVGGQLTLCLHIQKDNIDPYWLLSRIRNVLRWQKPHSTAQTTEHGPFV